MSLSSWGSSGNPASAAEECQKACDDASAMLQQLSRSELQNLMDDSEALNRLVSDLDKVKNLSKDKDALLVSNASLAEYNLSLEPKLITARQQLADVYVKAVELQKEHERNMMLIEDKTASTSPDTSLALLQTELAKVEEESEKAVEDFSSGQTEDVDSFVDNYAELRKVVHARRIKVEKLSQHLREPQRRDYISATSAAAPLVPARRSPVPPYPAPMSSAAYPPSQPLVPGMTPGFPQTAPYPPIGAANGWAQYPNAPVPVPFMRQ